MALLAERKRKVKFGLDPRNTEWSNDTSKFGQQLMEKMGWEKGKGLGANENGIKEPIKASYKSDTRGLGCTPAAAEAWIAHQDDFNDLLKMLNSGNTVASQPEKTEHVDGRKRFYGRFARGQVQTLRSTQDLDCIFGRRKHRSTKKDAVESVEPSTEPGAGLDQENPSEHGLQTITRSCSVQEYFAKKMAELQAKKLAKEETQGSMSNVGSVDEAAIDHVGKKSKSAKKDSNNLKTYNSCAPLPDLNGSSEDHREWYVPFLSLDSDSLQSLSEKDHLENKRDRQYETLLTQEYKPEVVSKKAKKRNVEESVELDQSTKVEGVSQKVKKKKVVEDDQLEQSSKVEVVPKKAKKRKIEEDIDLDQSSKVEEVPKKAKKRKTEEDIELDRSLKPEVAVKKSKKIVEDKLDQLPEPEVSKKTKKKKKEKIQLDHSPKPVEVSKKAKKKTIVEDVELVPSPRPEKATKKSKKVVEDIELDLLPKPEVSEKRKKKQIVDNESHLLSKPEDTSKKTKKKKNVENVELDQSPKSEEISKKAKKINTEEGITVTPDGQISSADVSEINTEKEKLGGELVSDGANLELEVQINVDPTLTRKGLLRKKSKKKRIKKPKTEEVGSNLFPGSNLHEINGYGIEGSLSQAAESSTPVVPKKSKKKKRTPRFKKVSN